MLQLLNVSRIFQDGTRAIDNVSLKVKKGEFCVLLGPSGAGKSTLMGMINGLVLPSKGTIRLWDEELNKKNLRGFQRRVAMIHQQLHLVPRLSVLGNTLTGTLADVGLFRSLFSLFPEKNKRRACRLLEEVGLEEKHLYRRAMSLSGGQQQRVAIARAFMQNPSIVLADEPVASLDPVISLSVLELLKQSARQHDATVLCSLHQVEYAVEFADRIIGLRQGKLIFDGPPSSLDEASLKDLYGSETIPSIEDKQIEKIEPCPACSFVPQAA